MIHSTLVSNAFVFGFLNEILTSKASISKVENEQTLEAEKQAEEEAAKAAKNTTNSTSKTNTTNTANKKNTSK